MRFRGTLMSSIVLSALAFGAVPALAQERADGSGDVAKALERDLGLSPDEVKAQGPLQEQAIKTDDELQSSLGDGYAGSFYDARAGRLVVMVSDESLLEKVKAAGAEPRLVKHPLRELDAIKSD